MKQKETYPIFNAIFYTVMIASAYWIYSTYTDRNPSKPKQVVQVKNDIPKQSATPNQVNTNTPPVEIKPKVEMSERQSRELMVQAIQRENMKELRAQGRCTGVFSNNCQ